MKEFRNNLEVNCGGEIIDQWGTFKRNKRDIVNEFLDSEGNQYILTNNLQGFYNKALIYQNTNNNNNYILVSYNTIVAEITKKDFIIYGYYSETTKRHINAFLERFGIITMSKQQILNNCNKWLHCKDFVA